MNEKKKSELNMSLITAWQLHTIIILLTATVDARALDGAWIFPETPALSSSPALWRPTCTLPRAAMHLQFVAGMNVATRLLRRCMIFPTYAYNRPHAGRACGAAECQRGEVDENGRWIE